MGTNVFSIGVSGLNAAQSSLSVVSHNISNVNTEGYSRQTVTQAERFPQNLGFGFIGQGVDVTNVKRSYDKFLTGQLQNAQTNANFYNSQVSQLNQINNLMADSSVGLNPAMQDFFGSVQTLSQDPSSIPSRQTVINMAQALATKFRTIDGRLQEIKGAVNSQIATTVSSVNALAKRIAELNTQIASMTGGNQVTVPNDLMDQRDQAMVELNKLVKSKAVEQSDGTYSVFIGNGQSLVLGGTVSSLATRQNPTDPTSVDLVYTNPNGESTYIPDKLIDGGDLGGLLSFRDGPMLNTENKLGTLAIDFSTAMNYQHKLGRDADGHQGGNLFTDLTAMAGKPAGAASQLQVLLSDPTTLAVSSSLTLGSGGITPANSGVSLSGAWASIPASYGWTNSSSPPDVTKHPIYGMTSMTVSASSPTSITATISGTNGSLTPYNVVADPDVENGYKVMDSNNKELGVKFKLSGQMQAGMTINIGTIPSGTVIPGENNNLLEMAKLQSRPIVDDAKNGTDSGLQSFQTHYSTTVSYVGNVTNSASLSSAAMDTSLKQATLNRSNMSGVNLDQEAADLMRYQQAYQASSKVIQIAQDIFSRLLQLGGSA